MKKYLNKNSGIIGYDIEDKAIKGYFKSGWIYTYTYESASEKYVEDMKVLAIKGEGLNSYINKYCHDRYSSKILDENNPDVIYNGYKQWVKDQKARDIEAYRDSQILEKRLLSARETFLIKVLMSTIILPLITIVLFFKTLLRSTLAAAVVGIFLLYFLAN